MHDDSNAYIASHLVSYPDPVAAWLLYGGGGGHIRERRAPPPPPPPDPNVRKLPYYAYVCLGLSTRLLMTSASKLNKYMGQCPAKSGLWGYNFITIKIAYCTKQHIFATVQPFPFRFRTLVSTSSLCVEIDFGALIIFHGVSAKIANTTGYNSSFLHVRVLKTRQIRVVHRGVL